ncbi:MAG: tautomerase family protein [Pseudomonadota bacterium]
MPILNVKLCVPPSQETSVKIAAVLTDLTVEILKKKRELTAVVIEYVAPTEWYIAGTALAAQLHRSFHLDIKVTEGTNTQDEKAAYIRQVFSSMESIIESLASASYIVIHDIQGDSWGYQGQTQAFRSIKDKGDSSNAAS